MSNSIDNLADQIRDIGEDLAPDLMQLIGRALDVEIARWQSQAPVDTGALKASIQKRMIDPYTWGVSFLEYGLYQNFGVEGINNKTTQLGVAGFVSSEYRPKSGAKYGFTSAPIGGKLPLDIRFGIAYNGINANPWFAATDQQLDQILQRVADRALQSTQL
jgi:hypothetical protein